MEKMILELTSVQFISGILVGLLVNKIWAIWESRKRANAILELLVHELWLNLTYIIWAHENYRNNLNDSENLRILKFAPRVTVFQQYLDSDLILALNSHFRLQIVECFAQLEVVRGEVLKWIELLTANPDIKKDSVVFKAAATPMLEVSEVFIRNALNIWVLLVVAFGAKHPRAEIQKFSSFIVGLLLKRKKIYAAFRASEHRGLSSDPANIVLCVENDTNDASLDVISIRDMVCVGPHR